MSIDQVRLRVPRSDLSDDVRTRVPRRPDARASAGTRSSRTRTPTRTATSPRPVWPSPSTSAAIRIRGTRPDPWDSSGPWCYTVDPYVRWEYCDVPFCGERHTRLYRFAGGVTTGEPHGVDMSQHFSRGRFRDRCASDEFRRLPSK